MKILLNIVTIILLFMASIACAQEADVEEQVTAKDLTGYLDLSVPETPAFTALGVTPENVISPGSQHELALAILDGVDQNGNAQSGMAIEASPYALAIGDQITIKEYKSDYLTRFLYNTKVSYATASGSSDSDKADRKAIGLRFSVFNNGDLRLNDKVTECFKTIPKPDDEDVLDITGGTTPDGAITILEEVTTPSNVLEAAGQCSKEASM